MPSATAPPAVHPLADHCWLVPHVAPDLERPWSCPQVVPLPDRGDGHPQVGGDLLDAHEGLHALRQDRSVLLLLAPVVDPYSHSPPPRTRLPGCPLLRLGRLLSAEN